MDKEQLLELLKEHLRVEVEPQTDYDTFGSSTDLHVRLVWSDDGTSEVLSEDWGHVSSERR